MKKASVLCILMLVLSCYFAEGQQRHPSTINPQDPAFREKFSQLSFDKNFSILAVRDQYNNYYMADFTQFQERFEKVWFISLLSSSTKIASIDDDLSQPRPWFMAENKYTDKEIATEFNDLKEKTLNASSSMTAEEKKSWLLKNDKLK